MNKEEKIEEFLGKLPKETVVKIKKLKFYKNLVLIRQRKNFLEEVETGELIKNLIGILLCLNWLRNYM